jgi:hypothetical protein
LYEGETTAFLTPSAVATVAVTFLSYDDQIVNDYHALLDSVVFLP